jgi:hypothetical protein
VSRNDNASFASPKSAILSFTNCGLDGLISHKIFSSLRSLFEIYLKNKIIKNRCAMFVL